MNGVTFNKAEDSSNYRYEDCNTFLYFNDFHGIGSDHFISTASISGTGAAITGVAAYPLEGAVGVLQLAKGTTATGRAAIISGGTNNLYSGNGQIIFEAKVKVATALADGTNAYTVRIGFGDVASTDFTDGAYFEYDYSSSVNWKFCRAANNIRTKTNSTKAVDLAYHIFKITISPDGTIITFYIDNEQVGQFTAVSDLQGTARAYACCVSLLSTVGTVDRIIHIDWLKTRWDILTRIGVQPSF